MNSSPSRRDLLSAGALAAGLALLNDAVGADNPAASVADRTSTIKLSARRPASSIRSIAGIANAAVFPLPVADWPTTSFPSINTGIAAD